jgi:hypothetical protein
MTYTPRSQRRIARTADRIRRLAPDDYVEREPTSNVHQWRPLTEDQRRAERALRYVGIENSHLIARSCTRGNRKVYWARRLSRSGVGQDEIWNALMFGTTPDEIAWICRLRLAGIHTHLLRELLKPQQTNRTRRVTAKLALNKTLRGESTGVLQIWARMMNRSERRVGLRLVAAGLDPYAVGWILGAVKDPLRRDRAFQLVADGIEPHVAPKLVNALTGNALAIARTLVLEGNHNIPHVIELAKLADS